MNTDANKQDEHMSTRATASAVRRSPCCSTRRGTAAVMDNTAEEEGGREVELESEPESDGSAGSN